MRQTRIVPPALDLNYSMAAQLASRIADVDPEIIEPVLVAWYDRHAAKMSPAIEGADVKVRWRDYGASHGGKLEIDVGDDFAFIYAESSPFDSYEPSPYANLHDAQGNEYLCQISLLRDPRQPSRDACTPLDDWTSRQT